MKVHTIRSTKLLAITAVTVLATGCAAAPGATHAVSPDPAPQLVVTASAPTTAAPVTTATAATTTAAPSTVEAAHVTTDRSDPAEVEHRRPLDDEHAGATLVALRESLFHSRFEGEEKLITDVRFRPLCDADGYPVVGNVFRKQSGYQVSTYCSNVRASHSPKR